MMCTCNVILQITGIAMTGSNSIDFLHAKAASCLFCESHPDCVAGVILFTEQSKREGAGLSVKIN